MGTHSATGEVDLRSRSGGRAEAEMDVDRGEIGRAGYAVFYGALALSAALTIYGLAYLVKLSFGFFG
ncbi:MAG: hypothetical protein P4L72_03540 [Parvibaculum sp.]|jgi:hypothetical protein|uniref:hypothetical protein n=1 Tax=Parvibaculum sp. TaxID=2024848 RepID=UPI00283C86FD|nr:hypothetical protein [Parvibaculum sp.]MDR3498281.1 hypothetical protein [Parvibaculum sp.]